MLETRIVYMIGVTEADLDDKSPLLSDGSHSVGGRSWIRRDPAEFNH